LINQNLISKRIRIAKFAENSLKMTKYILIAILIFFNTYIQAQTKINVTGNTDGNVAKISVEYLPYYVEELTTVDVPVLNVTAFKTEFNTHLPQCVKVKADSATYFLLVITEQDEAVSIRKGQAEVALNNEVNFYAKQGKMLGVGGGKNAIQQSFYNQFRQEFNDNYDTLIKLSKDKTIDAFEDELFTLKKKKLNWLEKAKQENPFANHISTLIKKEINYAYYACLLGYAANDCANKSTAFCKSLPGSISEEIKQLELNKDEMLYSDWYRKFIINYVAYYGSEVLAFKSPGNINNQVREEYKLIDAKLIGNNKPYALAKLLLKSCDKIEYELAKSMMNKLKELDKDGKVYKHIQQQCGASLAAKASEKKNEKALAKTSSIYPVLLNADGKEVYIDQFKGKVVYIDFWASWCGPCRQQFPFSKKLHESMTKKELDKIVFLYISIDDNEATWKKAVEQNALQGINVISRGGWSSEVCKFFNISSIPRYMILNKDGKIVEPDAKRPADETLKDDLLKLMAE
jgi:thiol-disulfide isomerase/thioredoxin